MSRMVEDLKWRYACKQFDSSKKITNGDFSFLLEALSLTASSYGMQPWKFVVVENTAKREALVGASWGQAQVKDASHLIVLCAPLTIDEAFVDSYIADTANTRNQDTQDLSGFKKMLMGITKKSPEGQLTWAKNQIYIALGTLLATCAELRIDSCPMEGFKAKEYDEILGLTELGLTSMVVCPVGYRHADDKYSDLKKVRFSTKDLTITI